MSMLTIPATDANTWRTATCVRLGVDPETMQPERATRSEVAEATELCHTCPLYLQCNTHAEAQGDSAYGVHAGQWWGDEPVWVVERTCENDGCAVAFRTEEAKPRRFCSAKCRVAAFKARREALSA